MILAFTCGNKKENPSSFRQLEAVVRIAESLAKMKLQAVAGEEEVDEALRLFQVSTLDAALSGNLSGVFGSRGVDKLHCKTTIAVTLKQQHIFFLEDGFGCAFFLINYKMAAGKNLNCEMEIKGNKR